MSYNPLNPNGQNTMANSSPSVIASNQTPIPVKVDQTTNGTTNRVNISTDGQVSTNGTVFVFSSINSSAAQLASSATFTGTIESVVNQQSFSILFFADQNATITIKQYTDAAGTKLNSSLAYTYTANGQFAKSGVLNGNYMNITVQNTGGSTTTTLQLDTAFGTIPSATQLNNAPIALNEINGTALSLGQAGNSASLPVTLSVENTQDMALTGQSAQTAVINNILSLVAGSTATDVVSYRSFAVQITSTGTGGTYIFEGANDNSNFQTIPVFNQALPAPLSITAAITATAASSIIYIGSCPFRYIRLRIVTTITGGSIQAFSTFTQVPFASGQLNVVQSNAGVLNTTVGTLGTVTPGTAAINLGKARNAAIGATDTGVGFLSLRNDTLTTFGTTGSYNTPITDKYGALITKDLTRHKRTYSLAFTLTLAATPTDIFQIIGSGTTTVSITKMNISGSQTTGGQATVTVSKRSTANTGGTSSGSVMVPHDSTDAAATAVGSIYTANPALGTVVGNIRIFQIPLAALTATTNNIVQIDFGERGRPIVLNGVAQALAINLSGAALTGGSVNVWMEFTEE